MLLATVIAMIAAGGPVVVQGRVAVFLLGGAWGGRH
jgi:hypothetical protein